MSEKFPELSSLDSMEGVPTIPVVEGPVSPERRSSPEELRMITTEEAATIIARDYPEFQNAEVSVVGQGQNAVTFEVNKEYIFRFPFRLTASVESKAETQTSILKSLEGKIDVEIPRIEFQGDNPVYSGYRKIEGTVFNKELLTTLTGAEKIQIGKDMAHFLHQMHAMPLSDAEKAGYTRKPFMTEAKRKETEEFVRREFGGEEQDYLLRMLKRFEELEANPEKEVALHGDLDLGNMFLTEDTKRLKGVIDFGEAMGNVYRDFFYAPIRDKIVGDAMIGEYERLSGEQLSREAIEGYAVSREIRFLMRYHGRNDVPLTKEWREKLERRTKEGLAF